MQLHLGFEREACHVACEPGDVDVSHSSQTEALGCTKEEGCPQSWTGAPGFPTIPALGRAPAQDLLR